MIQFVAVLMMIGGGITVSGDMVAGTHNLWGWFTVILGGLLLLAGARGPAKT